jgi:hypothetical protein
MFQALTGLGGGGVLLVDGEVICSGTLLEGKVESRHDTFLEGRI